jgi:hypothetical protein
MNRRFAAVAAVSMLVVGSIATAQAARQSSSKTTAICHKTSSTTKPYQRITVSTRAALKEHIGHSDDIIPAPRACPRTVLTPTAGGVALTIDLLGVAEQPDPADADGTGTATLRLRQGQGTVCYALAVKDVSLPATGAHIHRGAVDASGAVVVPLGTPDAQGAARGCAPTTRSVVNALLKNGTDYYVNVHTTDYPNGALRGQLTLPSGTVLLKAAMNGANEKPNAGDADGIGAGAFLFNADKGRLCYTLAARSILLPATASHIHRGAGDIAGPVIIPFSAPSANGTVSGCVSVDGGLLREIAQNPGGFYANIHTTDFPGGAVRAQLSTS